MVKAYFSTIHKGLTNKESAEKECNVFLTFSSGVKFSTRRMKNSQAHSRWHSNKSQCRQIVFVDGDEVQ